MLNYEEGIKLADLEELEDYAHNCGVDVINYHFDSSRIRGLYSDNVIAISDKVTTNSEKSCILAEELGHYHTSYGNIMNQHDTASRKQEHRARVWAYNYQVGLIGLIKAFNKGHHSLHEIAEFLSVTETFLTEALQYYQSKYGKCTTLDEYVIYFIPCLCIVKMNLK